MRIAVFSDIHGNIAAFEAVLADMDALGVARAVSLGDNVGYGPDPCPVLALLRSRGIVSVLGNHEAALRDRRLRRQFNEQSREALDLTEGWMDCEGREAIAAMPAALVQEGCRFVHGMPPDSPFQYLFQFRGAKLQSVFRRFDEDICFVGHTHELEVLRCTTDGVVSFIDLPRVAQGPGTAGEPLELAPDCRYLVNVGSVGQPRDGDNRAKYVIWDAPRRTLTFRHVAYDVNGAVRRFTDAGVPARYVNRLL